MCLLFATLKAIVKDICEMFHNGKGMNSSREIDMSTASPAKHGSKLASSVPTMLGPAMEEETVRFIF